MTKDLVLKTVSSVCEIDVRDILKRYHDKDAGLKNVVFARNLVMIFCRQYGLGSQLEITHYVNRRDHSLIISASRSVANDIYTNANRRYLYNKVQEALKHEELRVELNEYPTEISSEGLKYQMPYEKATSLV